MENSANSDQLAYASQLIRICTVFYGGCFSIRQNNDSNRSIRGSENVSAMYNKRNKSFGCAYSITEISSGVGILSIDH